MNSIKCNTFRALVLTLANLQLAGCSQVTPNGAKALPPLSAYLGNFSQTTTVPASSSGTSQENPDSRLPPPLSQQAASDDEGISVDLASYFANDTANGYPQKNRDIVAKMLADADINCIEFEDNVETGEIGSSAGTDIIATVMSGVGAIVTPVAASHIFSAAAGIATGVGGNVNQDYFNKVGVEAFSAAIDASFGKEFQSYSDKLNSIPLSDDFTINPVREYDNITAMLGICSLGDARATALNSITPVTQNQPSSSIEQDIQVTGTQATNASPVNATMTPSPSGNGFGAFNVPINKSDKPSDVIANLSRDLRTHLPGTADIGLTITSSAANLNDTLKIVSPSGSPVWTLIIPNSVGLSVSNSSPTTVPLAVQQPAPANAAPAGAAENPAALPAALAPPVGGQAGSAAPANGT